MKKVLVFAGVFIFVATAVSSIFAQNDVTFTGTAVSYGSGFNTRTRTSAFTMKITGVTPDLVARFSAVDLVKIASEALGGKGGGGRPDMAQAGGTLPANLPAALASVSGWVGQRL